MHVLVIPSEHFITDAYPLGGIFQLHQAEALSSAGYQVGILSFGIISPLFFLKHYHYPMYENKPNLNIYRCYMRSLYPQRWVIPQRGISFFQEKALEQYFSYKKRHGIPDIIHAHGVKYAAFISEIINAIDKVPYIITEHSSIFMYNNISDQWRSAMMKTISSASVMSAVSCALAGAIQKEIGIKKIEILPNIIDSKFIEGSLSKPLNKEFVFLNVASLDNNKNQADLIKAFALYFRGEKVNLRLGGTGPCYSFLKKLTKRLNIENQVCFLGHLDRVSTMREMQSANCFILSSLKETFGVVLIEALASGTPIISTRCGGADDIVTKENGMLVDAGDLTGLGNAMKFMLKNQCSYVPEKLRKDCQDRFGKAPFLFRVNKLYCHALGLN